MDKADKIKLIVQLTLAKLDIMKLKWRDGGYDWWHINEEGRSLLDEQLIEIDRLLVELKSK